MFVCNLIVMFGVVIIVFVLLCGLLVLVFVLYDLFEISVVIL